MSSSAQIPFFGLATGPDAPAPAAAYVAPAPFRAYASSDFVTGLTPPHLLSVQPGSVATYSPATFAGAQPISISYAFIVDGVNVGPYFSPNVSDSGRNIIIRATGLNCGGSAVIDSTNSSVQSLPYASDFGAGTGALADLNPIRSALTIVSDKLRIQPLSYLPPTKVIGAYLGNFGQIADGFIEAEIDTADLMNIGDEVELLYRTHGPSMNAPRLETDPPDNLFDITMQGRFGYRLAIDKSRKVTLSSHSGVLAPGGGNILLGNFTLPGTVSKIVLRAEFSGKTHKVFCDSRLMLTVTDTAILVPGHIGIVGRKLSQVTPFDDDKNCFFVRNIRAQSNFAQSWQTFGTATLLTGASYAGSGFIQFSKSQVTSSYQKFILHRDANSLNAHFRVDYSIKNDHGVDFYADVAIGQGHSNDVWMYAGSAVSAADIEKFAANNPNVPHYQFLSGITVIISDAVTGTQRGLLMRIMRGGHAAIDNTDIATVDLTNKRSDFGIYRIRIKTYRGFLRIYFNGELVHSSTNSYVDKPNSYFGLGYSDGQYQSIAGNRVYDNIAYREITNDSEFSDPGEPKVDSSSWLLLLAALLLFLL